MRNTNLALALTVALALGTTQCNRAPESDEPSARPPVPAALPSPAGPSPSPSPSPSPAPARVPSDVPAAVRVPIDGLPVFGDARALVTIVAFTDYECPYCAKADKTVATLRAELGDDVRVVLASRPLPMHERAAPAARAFLAAAEQGRAEAMHARLFADRGALDDAGLSASAKAIGLDVRAFESARTGASTEAALQRSLALATSLGADGTPTFFVNGRRMVGARTYDVFRAVVDEELARAKEMVASGIAREKVYDAIMAPLPLATTPVKVRAPESDETPVDVALGEAPARGSSRSPVTIALFSDFECPYCVRAEATLRTLETEYPGKVRVVFKHRPLPMHDHARLAAKASLAAESQGRFWEYHDVLVAHRDALDRVSLEGYARSVGLDVARFGRDLDDPRSEARINADELQAAKLHVEGTPTAFVNGRRIVGAQSLAVYKAAVDRALAAK